MGPNDEIHLKNGFGEFRNLKNLMMGLYTRNRVLPNTVNFLYLTFVLGT